MSAPSFLVLGTGQAARTHVRVLRRVLPEASCQVVSRVPERAVAFAQSNRAQAYHGDIESALADPRIDAVIVTTPPDTHAPRTLAALAAGKDVIVEKPAFLTGEAFDAVEGAASRAGRRVLVAENYHYKPLRRWLHDAIERGVFGQVRIVQVNAVKRQHADDWRGDPAVAGGGALFEGGIHWVSLMADLGLDVRQVSGHFPDAPPGHERSAVMVMDYAQGAVGVLDYSWEIPSLLRGLRLSRIWGTRRSLLFESNGLFAVLTGGVPRLVVPGLADIQGYRGMWTDFVRCLTAGHDPEFTLQRARRDVELIQSAYADVDPSRSQLRRLT